MGNIVAYQGEEVFAREVPEEDWNISTNSIGFSHSCHTHVLPFGYSEKTNANEEFTLQYRHRCLSR